VTDILYLRLLLHKFHTVMC